MMKNEQIDEAVAVLREGGVVAHATDTCYGFACDAFNQTALERLYALKNMPMSKPVSILVANFHEAQKYAEFSDEARVLAERYWPGALTLVLPRKSIVPAFLNPGVASIGIRVPGHALSLELAKLFGSPITTTSANISGLPSPYSIADIQAQFTHVQLKPDYSLDSGALSAENLPSTIIDMTGESPVIIRQGCLVVPGISD